jgi:NADPH2:quinone reductase
VVDFSGPLDASPLALKAASLHLEMVFSRIIHNSEPECQAAILDDIVKLVVAHRVLPIANTKLKGLLAETMRAAHECLETGRSIGKVVIET